MVEIVLPFEITNGDLDAQVDFAFSQASRLEPNPKHLNADAGGSVQWHRRTMTQIAQQARSASLPNEIWMLCKPIFRFEPALLGSITIRSWFYSTAWWWKVETI